MGTEREPRLSPRWLTEEDIGACVSVNEAIDALAQGIRLEAESKATNVDKALGLWSKSSSMHSLGSMMPERGYVGFKTWAHTPRGAAAVFLLFDAENGRLLAMMEAGLLGKLRTSGISGLATRALAMPGADEMALIGTGLQAMMQVVAVAATQPLRRLRVFSPTSEKRARFVAEAKMTFSFTVEEASSLDDAVAGMPIVTLITRAVEPFLDASMISNGAHINAAGAILPANAELKPSIFDRTSLVVVDSLGNAQKISRELRERFGSTDLSGWAQVKSLADVLAARLGRPPDADITLFKPMGMGLSDLSVATVAYQRAVETGVGSLLPSKWMPEPRWTAAGRR